MANDLRHLTSAMASSAGHGTSVAPRLRPKPAQQTSTTPSIGLTLSAIPLNQSPKNVISPIPASTMECDKFVANFHDKFLGAAMPRFSPSSTEADASSYRLTTPSNPVSPAALLSPFEQESLSTSTTVSIRPRPTALAHSQQPVQQMLSNSNSEKSLVSPLSGSFTWNPFGDPSPFSPISTLTEDQLFGAEFDKLRLEGSQTSIVTSPEEMKSERSVSSSYWGGSEPRRRCLSQALSTGMIASNGSASAQNGKELSLLEEDPFGSAPFTLPKRFKQKSSSSRLASKLSDRWRHAVGSHASGGQGAKESLIECTPTDSVAVAQRPGDNGHAGELLGLEKSALLIGGGGQKNLTLDDLISGGVEKASPSFIKLPLDDRNKYEKLNSNGITSDDSDSEFYPDSMGSSIATFGGGPDRGEHSAAGGGTVGCTGAGASKKHSFKHFVESNIPEKLQAVYHKVDKSQIKNVQIVKKLRSKVVAHGAAKEVIASAGPKVAMGGRRKGKRKAQLNDDANAPAEGANASDDDSIGSASDLRANDDFPDGEDEPDPKAAPNGGPPRKRAPFSRGGSFGTGGCGGAGGGGGGEGSVDDCISESIKTCGSSAYHAECESVTTNEDNTSRIVTRVRVKKRERLDSKHSVIDEDNSAEEDMIQGEKPLLLDDELDYESGAENNSPASGDEQVLMDPFTPEEDDAAVVKNSSAHVALSPEDDSEVEAELDPFAMAPFRKPFVARRNPIAKFMPVVHPIPEHFPTGGGAPAPPAHLSADFITSTPIKPPPEQSSSRSSQSHDIFDIPADRPMALADPLAAGPPSPHDVSPNVRRDIFGPSEPFPLSAGSSLARLAVSSPPASSVVLDSIGTLTSPPTTTIQQRQHVPLADGASQPQQPAISLFPARTPHESRLTSEHATVTLTHIIPLNSGPAISAPAPALPPPAYVSTSASLSSNHQTHHPHVPAASHELSARRNYINFSQIPSHSIACISPDNNYVNFRPDEFDDAGDDDDDDVRNLQSDEYDDNSSDTVVSSKLSSKGFLTKKQKFKYNHLHGKNSSSSGGGGGGGGSGISGSTSHGRDDAPASSTLGQKMKANVSGYRKVVSEVTMGNGRSKPKDGHPSFSKPSKAGASKASCSSSKAMGFSNMSFEDFPSDELADELGPTVDGTSLTAMGYSAGNGGGKLLKMSPFEVIRNEKMLLEAEKKFGSLKRRSNPFS